MECGGRPKRKNDDDEIPCTVWLDGKALDALPQAEKEALDRASLGDDKAWRPPEAADGPGAAIADTAVTLRRRKGKVEVTDGPFIETKEYLGGFLLIEAGDRDEAVEIASRAPILRYGPIEVRPIYTVPASPTETPEGAMEQPMAPDALGTLPKWNGFRRPTLSAVGPKRQPRYPAAPHPRSRTWQ